MTYALAFGCAIAVATAGRRANATAAGPQPGTAGVPEGGGFVAEQTCIACHATQPLNPDTKGIVKLEGVPARYTPSRRYTLTFSITHPDADRMRWGFQLTAVDTTTFRGAGNFVVTDPAHTQVVLGEHDRQYMQHTYDGTGLGVTGGYTWTFDWVAPAAGAGTVAFYGDGNASNIDGSKEGDLIYSPAPDPMAVAAGPATEQETVEGAHGDG